ncbi:fasciclin-2 isoform X2 [Folsomia candida]|uniref:fasciclin-2 isoform X2 n=1 Tax=Folsomia candida TaxID=158441 RepID=UPI000B8FCE0D|nr:fasciclin-2 isoform X2 [Folsomia candida]
MMVSKMELLTAKLFVFCCLLGGAICADAKLRIMPEEQSGVYRRALGKPSIFTCIADVEIPDKVAEFRWWWPDMKPIEPTDSRVEIMKDTLGTLTLVFSSVQEEDLGTYRCTATYALNQQLTANFTLRAFVPITFDDAPEYQFAVKGTDSKVKCSVKADPPPIVDWKKDHAAIQTNAHIVVDNDGILIRNVQESDEGVYTCRVRVQDLGTVEERHIKLEVQEKPVIISDPVELEGVEEERVTFQCLATGKPAAEYEWVGVRHQELFDSPRYTVDKYKGTLTIDALKPEDSGTYRCTARNTAGFDTVTSRLFVVTKPVIEEFINITSQVGANAVLTCRASGDPAPDIVFHKDSVREPFSPQGSQQDTRIFTDQRKDGRVTVAQVKVADLLRTDDGLYKCIAYNKRTRTELDGHLTVEFPPTFANTPMKEQWAWDGNPKNLSCLAEAIPNATITWFIVNHPVEIPVYPNNPDPNIVQYGFQSNSSLQVRAVDITYYRAYKAVATNKLGTAEHLIYLREARKPGQILQVIVQEKTATSISYRIVGPMDDGGLPLKGYVVQYREDRTVGWDEHTSVIKTWPVDQYVFIIEGLEPLHTYYIRFAAENDVGIGHWAFERPETMPRRSAPEPPLILSEAYNGVANTPYPDRFELRWSVPQDNGERIEAFEISYAPVRNYTIHKGAQEVFEWESIGQALEEEKPLGEPRHVLRNLVPGTYYRVEIRARNAIGKSQPAQIIVRTSPIPGDSSSYDLMRGESFQSLPMLIVIIAVVLLLILLFVDVICCKINQMGILWAITHKLCHKKKSRESLVKTGNNDASIHEKQPLADDNGYRQHSHIVVPETMKVNGNGNKNGHGQARDSEV